MEFITEKLAIARRVLADASQSADAIQMEVDAMQSRVSDADKRYSDAFAALRGGEISEEIGAARMSLAKADREDVSKMLAELAPAREKAVETSRQAMAEVNAAEMAMRREEHRLTLSALDMQIKAIEQKLCAALAERYRLAGSRGSLFNIWTPGDALRRAVTAYEAPTN